MELFIFFISILISVSITPLIQKIFIKKNKFDAINQRSSHNVVATRTGGIVCFFVVFILSVYFYLNGEEIYDYSLLVPLSTMFIVGVYDDFYNADFKLKFLMQIIVAKMLIDQGLIIDNFYGIFGIEEISRLFSQIFTVFVFLVIVNSINFIDGTDGLAITEIIKLIITFEFIKYGSSPFWYLSIIIIGCLIPLYYFNFKRENKVFLGDGGSLLFGTLISIYVFNFLNSNTVSFYSFNKPILSVLILLYPMTDLLRVFIIRISKKQSPFRPDNNHLHHILLRKNLSHWQIGFILPICFFIISLIAFLSISAFKFK